MRQLPWILLSCLLNVVLVFSASALDFSNADALFANREQGPAAIAQARVAYKSLVNQAEGSDLVYAVEQISRLDVYRALSIPESQIHGRKPVLEACLQDIESIRPGSKGLGANPVYLYWKVTCRALWCEANGILSSLNYSQELVNMIADGLNLDPTYEGGGFDRAAGVIYSKLPAINPFGPSGDLTKALSHFESAINSPAYSLAKNPATETGDYHYPTYHYYAQALVKAGRQDDAVHVLDSAISRIESGDLPVGREPETRLTLSLMKTLRASL